LFANHVEMAAERQTEIKKAGTTPAFLILTRCFIEKTEQKTVFRKRGMLFLPLGC